MKIKKRKNIIIKSEKGAITLYVLLACLFFVFTLTGVYISNLNKLKSQEQDIKQIQENYAREVQEIDEIYEELLEKLKIAEISQLPLSYYYYYTGRIFNPFITLYPYRPRSAFSTSAADGASTVNLTCLICPLCSLEPKNLTL